MKTGTAPLIAILMGSRSDWETMQHSAAQLKELGVPFEAQVLSAHRAPEALREYVQSAPGRGLQVFIAAAGGPQRLVRADVQRLARPDDDRRQALAELHRRKLLVLAFLDRERKVDPAGRRVVDWTSL